MTRDELITSTKLMKNPLNTCEIFLRNYEESATSYLPSIYYIIWQMLTMAILSLKELRFPYPANRGFKLLINHLPEHCQTAVSRSGWCQWLCVGISKKTAPVLKSKCRAQVLRQERTGNGSLEWWQPSCPKPLLKCELKKESFASTLRRATSLSAQLLNTIFGF